MQQAYAGIGSRKTPGEVLEIMRHVAVLMAEQGWVLRSGGADGADSAFEEGCRQQGGEMEIFLPWKGFNSNPSPLFDLPAMGEALAVASDIHPAWNRTSQGAKKLLARNIFQILGKDLESPSSVVIAYTTGGGGTGFALSVADFFGIPAINIHDALKLIARPFDPKGCARIICASARAKAQDNLVRKQSIYGLKEERLLGRTWLR